MNLGTRKKSNAQFLKTNKHASSRMSAKQNVALMTFAILHLVPKLAKKHYSALSKN